MGNWESFPFSQRQTNAVCFRGWEIIMCWSVLTSRAVNSHCLHCSAGAEANRVVWSWGGPIQLTQSLHCWQALSELTRAQPAPAKAKELALPVDLWSLCFAGITDKFRVLCPEFLTVVSVGYPGVDLLGWQAEVGPVICCRSKLVWKQPLTCSSFTKPCLCSAHAPVVWADAVLGVCLLVRSRTGGEG